MNEIPDINVGIIGASGVTGSNILNILLKKKYVNKIVLFSTSFSGQYAKNHIEDYHGNLVFEDLNIEEINKNEYKLNFLVVAVPHGESKKICSNILNKDLKIIDLSSDHRLDWTYGLPELYKKDIASSKKIGNPGCYATACLLSIIPLMIKNANIIEHVVFDCISGYSGGGKDADKKYDIDNNIVTYSLVNHFHLKEIKNEINKLLKANNLDKKIKISFTPHVVPVYSGLMCTTHVIFSKEASLNKKEIKKDYIDFYKNSLTFIKDKIPCTKDVVGSNECHLGGFEIDEDGQLIIISVIDNLMKGAVSQAIENLELMIK